MKKWKMVVLVVVAVQELLELEEQFPSALEDLQRPTEILLQQGIGPQLILCHVFLLGYSWLPLRNEERTLL